MRRQTAALHNERGAVLVIGFLVLTILAIIGVAATTTSNFAMLGLVFALSRRLGMRVQPQTVSIALLPMALLLGKAVAIFVLGIVIVCSLVPSVRLLTGGERRQVASVWQGFRVKFHRNNTA